MTVLVVEDDRPLAELLRRALEGQGNDCHLAQTTEQADRLIDRHDVDAVTLDLSMPGTGGLVWLESMARARPELARKTLVITGLALEPESISRLARCGAGMLAKPFTLESLNDAVRSQLVRSGGSWARQN